MRLVNDKSDYLTQRMNAISSTFQWQIAYDGEYPFISSKLFTKISVSNSQKLGDAISQYGRLHCESLESKPL